MKKYIILRVVWSKLKVVLALNHFENSKEIIGFIKFPNIFITIDGFKD